MGAFRSFSSYGGIGQGCRGVGLDFWDEALGPSWGRASSTSVCVCVCVCVSGGLCVRGGAAKWNVVPATFLGGSDPRSDPPNHPGTVFGTSSFRWGAWGALDQEEAKVCRHSLHGGPSGPVRT